LPGTVPNSGKLRSKPTTKIRKNKNENHSFKIGTPEGKRRIWVSIPTPKSQVCYTNLKFVDLSQEI
jgi:hypothetical protein